MERVGDGPPHEEGDSRSLVRRNEDALTPALTPYVT